MECFRPFGRMVSSSFGQMSVREDIVGSCEICSGSGHLRDGKACQCLLKARSIGRLKNAGFFMDSLDFVSSDNYVFPMFEYGEDFINFFANNLETVEQKGLCIWSKENGSGKTTLAHYLMYHIAKYYSDVSQYSTHRSYGFQHIEEFVESFQDKNRTDVSWKTTWFVLDDLGNEDKSAKWKKEGITTNLPRMLHYRRNYNLPTIITSNYSPGDLSRLYESALDSLLEIRVDGSLGGSKIREVKLCGVTDFRLDKTLGGWTV